MRGANRSVTPSTTSSAPIPTRKRPMSCMRASSMPEGASAVEPGPSEELVRRRRRPGPAAEVRVGERGRRPSLGGARQESFLDQERLVHVLDRVPLLADGGGERLDADRTAGELVDDRQQEGAVHLV